MSNEHLNQSEIDALLGKTGEDNNQKDLSEIERDTLAEIGNISMGSAATALSTLINRKVTITVPEVSVKSLAEIKDAYPIPCIVVNIQYRSGLKGENLLVIKEHDAAIIGDLMMGGTGEDVSEEIGEIELSAVTEAMNMMMGSAATSMSDLFSYAIDISPPETQRRNLAIEALDVDDAQDIFAVIAFRIEIENLVDSTMLQVIDIEFAKNMVEQLMDEDLESEQVDDLIEDFQEQSVAQTAAAAMPEPDVSSFQLTDLQQQQIDYIDPVLGNLNIELIKDIPVRVRAVLGRTRMSIDNILKLGPGNIMELDTIEGEPIDVYANETLIARGEVIIVDEQFGIRITEISNQKNRIKSIS